MKTVLRLRQKREVLLNEERKQLANQMIEDVSTVAFWRYRL